MKRLQDIDFKKTYGEPPQSFERRVKYALRQTEEEKPMKRFTLRTAVLVAILVLALGAAAYAAITSNTAELFGWFYGTDKKDELLTGDIASSGQSTRLGDVMYTLEDVIYKDGSVYATCSIKPAEGANVVLIAEDYGVNEPAGYLLHYGEDEKIPEDYKSYADLAKERGAKILLAKCVGDSVIGADGTTYMPDIGYSLLPQPDGSIQCILEMVYGDIERSPSYELVLSIANWEVTLEGDWLREEPNDTWLKENWTVTVTPEIIGMEPTLSERPEPTATPAPDGSELRVMGGWLGDERYQQLYPDRGFAKVGKTFDENGASIQQKWLLENPDGWDVAVIDTNYCDLDELIGAGLALDLSGDAALSARVGSMFQPVQAQARRGDGLYALPIAVSSNATQLLFASYHGVRELLKLTDADMPHSYKALADFAERYMAMDKDARSATVFLYDSVQGGHLLHFLRYMAGQYAAQYADANGVADFDTPAFRDALLELDRLGMALDAEKKLNYGEAETLYEVMSFTGGDMMNESLCLLRLGDETALPARLTSLVINARSPRVAETLTYAACAIDAYVDYEMMLLAQYDYDERARAYYDNRIEWHRAQDENEEYVTQLEKERDSGNYPLFWTKEELERYAAEVAPYLSFKHTKYFSMDDAITRYARGETVANGLIGELNAAQK